MPRINFVPIGLKIGKNAGQSKPGLLPQSEWEPQLVYWGAIPYSQTNSAPMHPRSKKCRCQLESSEETW